MQPGAGLSTSSLAHVWQQIMRYFDYHTLKLDGIVPNEWDGLIIDCVLGVHYVTRRTLDG